MMKKWLAWVVFFGALPFFAVVGTLGILEIVHLSFHDGNLLAYDARQFFRMLVLAGGTYALFWFGMFFFRELMPDWWKLIDPEAKAFKAGEGSGRKKWLAHIALVPLMVIPTFMAGWLVYGSGVVIKPHGAGLELVLVLFLFIASTNLLMRMTFYWVGRIWPEWESLLGGSARPSISVKEAVR